jgi:hypothetical protein
MSDNAKDWEKLSNAGEASPRGFSLALWTRCWLCTFTALEEPGA